ncbi:MAG: hypothetical protein WCB31_09120 [Nitrososphaeraceae archaeon]
MMYDISGFISRCNMMKKSRRRDISSGNESSIHKNNGKSGPKNMGSSPLLLLD